MTNLTNPAAITISRALLLALRDDAAEYGDDDQVTDCNRALKGDAAAMTSVALAAADSDYSLYDVVDGELVQS